jgi:hypothetical protein
MVENSMAGALLLSRLDRFDNGLDVAFQPVVRGDNRKSAENDGDATHDQEFLVHVSPASIRDADARFPRFYWVTMTWNDEHSCNSGNSNSH